MSALGPYIGRVSCDKLPQVLRVCWIHAKLRSSCRDLARSTESEFTCRCAFAKGTGDDGPHCYSGTLARRVSARKEDLLSIGGGIHWISSSSECHLLTMRECIAKYVVNEIHLN